MIEFKHDDVKVVAVIYFQVIFKSSADYFPVA